MEFSTFFKSQSAKIFNLVGFGGVALITAAENSSGSGKLILPKSERSPYGGWEVWEVFQKFRIFESFLQTL